MAISFSEILGELTLNFILSCTDTFTSSGGSKPRPTAGLKRRRKSARGPSAPQSKRQRLTRTDNRAAAARDGYSSNKQRRKGGVVVRFADKRKRTVKGRQFQGDGGGGGGVKRRAGGQIFRTRVKAS